MRKNNKNGIKKKLCIGYSRHCFALAIIFFFFFFFFFFFLNTLLGNNFYFWCFSLPFIIHSIICIFFVVLVYFSFCHLNKKCATLLRPKIYYIFMFVLNERTCAIRLAVWKWRIPY
ncbi:hypothetical protein PVBDA_0500540 [Plasmodium vinckei brucechwatti]|uniref:Uncharacterized protein n=1 Tax=Plasmodium vinckei brucechwatti TaxID=119398 RepID=A0A6V7RWN0_PLAVN|nr:hypothetical protein PVBDA_0500540 [Plasmodium vinckei brucechwatti]